MFSFKKSIITLFIIINIGVWGYHLIEDLTLLDAFYMTMISLTTVGYGEVTHLSSYGKIFTILFITGGIGYAGFIITNLIAFIVGGNLNNFFRGKKMDKIIKSFNEHILVCGFGEVGKAACSQLDEFKKDFVVIEKDPVLAEEALARGYLTICGDATEEAILEQCNVKKAQWLITTLSNTSDNTFVLLAVKYVNENITIIARGTDARSETILRKAGADQVIFPAQMGGRKMVDSVCRQPTLDLVVSLIQDRKIDMRFAEVSLGAKNKLIGKTLMTSNIKGITGGIMVIGISRGVEDIILNPSPHTEFLKNDKLILLGNASQIRKLQEYIHFDRTDIKYIEKN